MRHLSRLARWTGSASLVLPLALVVFPGCDLVFLPERPDEKRDAVFCDVEKRSEPRRCATALDRQLGRKLAEGAIDLVAGQSSTIGLDFGEVPLFNCAGEPEAVTFEDASPLGGFACVNASDLPAGGVQGLCEAQCLEKNGSSPGDAPQALRDFCATHARPSIGSAVPFLEACESGKRSAAFVDPRLRPEPVAWTNLDGLVVSGPESNSLVRTIPPSPLPPDDTGFQAGATSEQIITRGDAYVEFTAGGLGGARIVGVSSGEVNGDSTNADVDFGVRLTIMGKILISESGVLIEKAPGDPVWGNYTPDSRIRVRVTALPDGSHATITYEQVFGPCDPNTFCMSMPLRPPSGPAEYPFRIDTSFKEAGTTVNDVRVVYIR